MQKPPINMERPVQTLFKKFRPLESPNRVHSTVKNLKERTFLETSADLFYL